MKALKKYISPILLLIAAIIWGFAFVAQKSAATVPPLTLIAARNLIATVFVFAIIPIFDKIRNNGRSLISRRGIDFNKTEIISGALCGIFLAAASVLQQIGINDTDAGKASFITALYVVIVPIYGLFMKKRAPINVWLGVVIAVLGFYLLCINGEFEISRADLMVFLCAFIFAFHIVTIDRFSPKCDGVRMSCLQFLVSSLICLVFALFLESPISFDIIGASILPILYLGVCSSGIAYTLQIVGQAGTNPAVASVILSLESVFGVLGGAMFLKEKLETREYIGCAVVFLAVILAQLDIKAIFKKSAPTPCEENEDKQDN